MSLWLLLYPLHCDYVPVLTDWPLCGKAGLPVFSWPLSEVPLIPIVSSDQRESPQHPSILCVRCPSHRGRAAGWGEGCSPVPPQHEEGPSWTRTLRRGRGMKDGLPPFRLITSALLMFLPSWPPPACPADASYHFSQIVRQISINPVALSCIYLGEIVASISDLKKGWVVFPRYTTLFNERCSLCLHPFHPFRQKHAGVQSSTVSPRPICFVSSLPFEKTSSRRGQASHHLHGNNIPVLSFPIVKFMLLEGSLPHCHERQQVTHQLCRKLGRVSFQLRYEDYLQPK